MTGRAYVECNEMIRRLLRRASRAVVQASAVSAGGRVRCLAPSVRTSYRLLRLLRSEHLSGELGQGGAILGQGGTTSVGGAVQPSGPAVDDHLPGREQPVGLQP